MYTRSFSDCPVLPSSISNGFVNGSGSVEGSQYKFSCRQGYSLVGRETLFCNDKGAWSGSVPKCLKGNSTVYRVGESAPPLSREPEDAKECT